MNNSRREFLKKLGLGSAVVGTAVVTGGASMVVPEEKVLPKPGSVTITYSCGKVEDYNKMKEMLAEQKRKKQLNNG
jgi:hypothetical protein